MQEISVELSDLTEEKRHIQESYESLRIQHEELDTRHAMLQEDYTKMEDENYTEKIRDLKAQVEKLTEKNGTLTNDTEKSHDTIEKLTNKLHDINEELNQKKGALEVATKQLDLLESKNAELVNDKMPHLLAEHNELQQNYDMLLSYSNVCKFCLFSVYLCCLLRACTFHKQSRAPQNPLFFSLVYTVCFFFLFLFCLQWISITMK